jgi:hypothetical protein
MAATNLGESKSRISHSESYPLGISNNTSSNISKDVFTNAPFKPKLVAKQQQQQQQQQSMVTNKISTISPSSSHSTSSSNSQLIDLTVPSQTNVDSSVKETTRPSPPRRPVGSAGLATNFSTLGSINTTNDTYYFHSDRANNDGHSSSEELTSSSSTRKRHYKKKASNTGNESQQHAYANLSFNDAIVDELL